MRTNALSFNDSEEDEKTETRIMTCNLSSFGFAFNDSEEDEKTETNGLVLLKRFAPNPLSMTLKKMRRLKLIACLRHICFEPF